MSTVSAAALRTGVLEPAMDSLALNRHQFNPDPEVNSILEHLQVRLGSLPVSPLRTELMALTEAAIESNLREGSETMAVTGFADKLSAELHRIETAGAGEALSAKAVARRLRGPLETVRLASASARELTAAHQLIRATVADVPSTQLLSTAVKYELGKKKFAVLASYVEGQAS